MRPVLFCSLLLLLTACAAKPATGPDVVAEAVSYRSRGETVRGLLYRPAGEGPFPAVVVVHGDYGLTAGVKEQARRLGAKGYLVLAVDLYRGQVVSDLMDAHILDRGLPEDRVLADLKAAVDYLVGRPDVRADSLGAVGWDSGGGHALDAAIRDPRLRAVVVCYGRLTTDPELLAPLQASVLGIFAGKDEGITPEIIDQFQSAMRRAGKRVAGIHVYPECGHGFMNPATPHASDSFAASAAADAWEKIEAYLAAELQR
jgi:carboxymethylenebutenolidase